MWIDAVPGDLLFGATDGQLVIVVKRNDDPSMALFVLLYPNGRFRNSNLASAFWKKV